MTKPIENRPAQCCEVCGLDLQVPGYGLQYGTLQARWGYGARHDGECYRVCLCETCFFHTLAFLRQERRIHTLFEDVPPVEEGFGLVGRDDLWGDR